jgi:hypothetical protein
MQTDPNEDHHHAETQDGEPPLVTSHVGESGKVQGEREQQDNQSTHNAPTAVKRSWLWCRQRFWDSWHFDESPSVFEALTFVVSVVGVIFLLRQMGQTEAALQEAREANRLTKLAQAREAADAPKEDERQSRLIGATETSAEAAKDAANAAKSSASAAVLQANAAISGNVQAANRYRQDNRARIVFDSVNLQPIQAGERIQVTVRFKNIGKVDALNYMQIGMFTPAPKTDATPPYPDMPPRPPISSSVEPNGVSLLPLRGDRVITEGEAAAMNKGDVLVYVWGRIAYDDGFGANHARRFCEVIDPSTKFARPCTGNDPND